MIDHTDHQDVTDDHHREYRAEIARLRPAPTFFVRSPIQGEPTMAVYDPETGKMIEPPTRTSDAAKAVLFWLAVIIGLMVIAHGLGWLDSTTDIGPGLGN